MIHCAVCSYYKITTFKFQKEAQRPVQRKEAMPRQDRHLSLSPVLHQVWLVHQLGGRVSGTRLSAQSL